MATPYSVCTLEPVANISDEPQPATTRAILPGFASFSDFLSSDLDLQIYRRFDRLAARNLAYLQSELASIEAKINALDDESRKELEARQPGWMELERSDRSWETMERRSEEGNGRDIRRMELIKRLRAVMAEYQDALLRQSQILNLEHPPARTRVALQSWYQRHRPLVGDSYSLLDSDKDLVTLRTMPDQDRLTLFLQQHLGSFMHTHKLHGDDKWDGISYFSELKIRRLVAVLSVVFSALLLLGAIYVLYYVPTMDLKLGFTALFTVLFAASVGLLTNARKVEVYAATAAYAAVLTVFISGNAPQQSVK